MKAYKILATILLSVLSFNILFAQNNEYTHVVNLTYPKDNSFYREGEGAYTNNLRYRWNIDIKQKRTVKIDFEAFIDIEDYLYIYEVDDSGNLTEIMWGNCGDKGTVYTTIPNGKAVIVFWTNDNICASDLPIDMFDEPLGVNGSFSPGPYVMIDELAPTTYLPTRATVGKNLSIGSITNFPAKLYVEEDQGKDAVVFSSKNSTDTRLSLKYGNTQIQYGEVFRLQHSFNNNVNNGFITFNRGENYAGGYLTFGSNGVEQMRIARNGNIGIGTINPMHKLDVKGSIRATEIKIESVSQFADYVFEPEYQLPSLQSVEQHILDKGHLPEIPSASEVKENGIDLVEMQVKLLKKIEELTLYIIELHKRMETMDEK